MNNSLLSLSLQRLDKDGGVPGAYTKTRRGAEELWKDLQDLLRMRKYGAAKACAEQLYSTAVEEKREALQFRLSLVLPRLCILLGQKAEGEGMYRRLLASVFGEDFVYSTPYSFTTAVFKEAEKIPEERLFLFKEYSENVLSRHPRRKQERLYYQLLDAHAQHKDVWSVPCIELESLPEHVREEYTYITTGIYITDPKSLGMDGKGGPNKLHSREVRNHLALLHSTMGSTNNRTHPHNG
ncbi:hypothetical protein NECID01_1562 [Nematocida sp. AWRm77]|nr:hypothetical protein NECID01_1562 [Nematocida sp. AWRm77]